MVKSKNAKFIIEKKSRRLFLDIIIWNMAY